VLHDRPGCLEGWQGSWLAVVHGRMLRMLVILMMMLMML
jgi:hypothetical protein